MGQHTYQKRFSSADRQPAEVSSPEGLHYSNSALAAMTGADSPSGNNLSDIHDSIMQRFSAPVRESVQAQIPTAEAEADRLSASVKSGSPVAVKAAMGRRMGADFSGVRFHTGKAAEAKASAVDARAYTSGNDVYFGEGGFDPAVAAHELVHTAQQGMVAAATPTVATPVGGVQRELPNGTQLSLKNKRHSKHYRKDVAYQNIITVADAYNQAVKDGDLHKQQTLRSQLNSLGRTYSAPGSQNASGRQRQITNMLNQLSGDNDRVQDFLQSGDRSDIDAIATKNPEFYANTMLPYVKRQMMSRLPRQGAANQGQAAANIDLTSRDSISAFTNQIFPDTASLLDPVQRDALRSDPGAFGLTAEQAEAVEDEMNHKAIAASMKLPDRNNASALSPKEAALAEQSGRDMAHLMFSMQLGKINITEDNNTTHDYGAGKNYSPTMASLISNGGRTKLDFGKTSNGVSANDVYRNMMELTSGNSNDIAHDTKSTRPFATHLIDGKMREKKGFGAAARALFSSSFKHRGFNPAIGGAGNKAYATKYGKHLPGEAQATITANGQSGHMYMGVKDSSDTENGGMLVGLETSKAQEYNLAGKKHDAKATSATFSPTGSRKDALIGAKTDGRTVDLTGITTEENVNLQQMLSARMTHLAQKAHNGNDRARDKYNAMMDQLSGSKMTPEALAQMLNPSLFKPNASPQKLNEKQQLINLIHRAQNRGQ